MSEQGQKKHTIQGLASDHFAKIRVPAATMIQAVRAVDPTATISFDAHDAYVIHCKKELADACVAALQAVQIVPETTERAETGAVRFGDDRPGVFIRGDDAYDYAVAIGEIINKFAGTDTYVKLMELQSLLLRARIDSNRHPAYRVSVSLRPWVLCRADRCHACGGSILPCHCENDE